MLLDKSSSTKQLDYVAFIIKHLRKRRVGGLRGHRWVSMFEAYNKVVASGLG